jgi:hypothetical protein
VIKSPAWMRCAAALLAAGVAAADPTIAGTGRPAVVELYTSQGCSSCPPADALLGELARRPDVLALAFHVDYWDDLGWRDRFELPVAMQRQRQYARQLGSASVYTPQMVVDGTADVVGGDAAGVARLIASPRASVPVQISTRDGELLVSVAAANGMPAAEVTLLSYLPQAQTAIGRGENAGRALREYNIVRSCAALGRWQGAAAEWRVRVADLPADARAVAVLIQQPGPGAIIGAAQLALAR